MIVDSSAVLAVLNDEPEATHFAGLIEQDPTPKISAVTLVEIAHAAGRTRHAQVDEFLAASGATIVAFDEQQAHAARDAFYRFGRGSRHPAKLNFGDCLTYALVKTTGEPLLFKGDDFTHTDVTPAR